MLPAPFNIPVAWSNQAMTNYHGTTTQHLTSLTAGINPSRGRTHTDFGVGFYVTTLLSQAQSWAWQAAQAAQLAGNLGVQGCVLTYTLDRDAASQLDTLAFVRGDRFADDFWSFIFHCRQGQSGHGRVVGSGFYDIVYGPVTAFWQQRSCMIDSDQISFHTTRAASLLSLASTAILP